MSANLPLSATQQQVLALIAAGESARAAAAKAGVHRHTVANWLRLPQFRDSLAGVQWELALALRDQVQALTAQAFQTIRDILADPLAPASVRLKAALAILDRSAAPLPPAPEIAPAELAPSPETVVQKCPTPIENEPLTSEFPNEANRAAGPKSGRNRTCPCGSGLKFKRCCLRKFDLHWAEASAA